ncbi:unnamed protein product, partial [Aphanomyces euteiches]
MKKAGPNAAGKRTRSASNEVKERTRSKLSESSDDSDSDDSVEGDEVRVQTQRCGWLTSAEVDEETQNQKRSRSPSTDYGIFTDETTDVQRKLFNQLAAAVPQYKKKNTDLTHDEYLKIHNAALLCEAAQQLYNVTERRVCGVDRQAYDSIEEYLEADNPFDFEDEELRRAKKKHGKDRRDVIVHHDATCQDVHDHHDTADPQDATRYVTDRRDVIDLNRAADLQHGHDLVVCHQEDDLRPADDLAAGLQD